MYACIYIPRIVSCSSLFYQQAGSPSASGAKNLVGRVDSETAKVASSALSGLARLFSPLIEFVDDATVIIPIAPLTRLMGGPNQIASEIARRLSERGLNGNIGIAAQPDTAVLTARSIPGATIILPGQERRMLGKLAVSVLPVSDESLQILEHWGIHTLDEFCSLPEAGVLERLGKDGLKLLQLAKGELKRPLRPESEGINYTERFETENPLTLLEPLMFLLGRLMQELCERLRSQSRATTQMRLHLDLVEGAQTSHERILQLPFPTHDSKVLLKLLQLDLEAHPPQGAVSKITLSVLPVAPRKVQHDLYTPPAPEPERLELTLGKIRAMVGLENVGSPELLDTHRRDAWIMRPSPSLNTKRSSFAPLKSQQHEEEDAQLPLAFRYFRPPLRARVELAPESKRPQRVFAQHIYGAVLECAGPWKASGDWFTTSPWIREEWDLGLNDGGLYRAYTTPDETWFLEGAYD
jgi:protein ImuB